MKKASRWLGIVLVIAIFAAMAAGCGSSETTEIKTPTSVSTGSKEPESKPADSAVAPDKTPDDTNEAASAENTDNASEEAPDIPAAGTEVTIEEAVVFDQGGIKITAKSLDMTGFFGPAIKLLVENDSSKSVTVQARNSSVNGYMVDNMMSVDVAAGKKANDTLTLAQSDLDAAGITTIADIEFSFHVFDADTWDDIINSDLIRIETSAADGFEYTYDDSGDFVYNENGIEIVVKGLSENESCLGPSLVVYISNTGSRNVTIQAQDVSINGFMVDPFFSCDILAGKHAIDTITFSSTELEENDIETIEDIDLAFHIFDMNSWNDIANTAPVTISFS